MQSTTSLIDDFTDLMIMKLYFSSSVLRYFSKHLVIELAVNALDKNHDIILTTAAATYSH